MSLTELRRRAGLMVFLDGIPYERALVKVAEEHPELAGPRKRQSAELRLVEEDMPAKDLASLPMVRRALAFAQRVGQMIDRSVKPDSSRAERAEATARCFARASEVDQAGAEAYDRAQLVAHRTMRERQEWEGAVAVALGELAIDAEGAADGAQLLLRCDLLTEAEIRKLEQAGSLALIEKGNDPPQPPQLGATDGALRGLAWQLLTVTGPHGVITSPFERLPRLAQWRAGNLPAGYEVSFNGDPRIRPGDVDWSEGAGSLDYALSSRGMSTRG